MLEFKITHYESIHIKKHFGNYWNCSRCFDWLPLLPVCRLQQRQLFYQFKPNKFHALRSVDGLSFTVIIRKRQEKSFKTKGTMRERILNNWTINRFFYLIIGLFIAISSGMNNEWLGLIFGLYFASMGLFSFGCAAGNCCSAQQNSKRTFTSNETDSVEYEELR